MIDEEFTLTRAQLAQRIDFSQSVIRKWEREFAEFVTSPPGQKGLAQARVYPLADIVLFGVIAQLRREGFPLEKIRELLPERLAQARERLDEEGIDEGDERAQPIDNAPPDAEQQRVALTLYLDVVKALEATEGELNATTGERDYLRERVAELEDKLVDAERRAAAAEAQRDMLAGRPPSFWQRLFGGGQKSE